jgi:hypothetical protein
MYKISRANSERKHRSLRKVIRPPELAAAKCHPWFAVVKSEADKLSQLCARAKSALLSSELEDGINLCYELNDHVEGYLRVLREFADKHKLTDEQLEPMIIDRVYILRKDIDELRAGISPFKVGLRGYVCEKTRYFPSYFYGPIRVRRDISKRDIERMSNRILKRVIRFAELLQMIESEVGVIVLLLLRLQRYHAAEREAQIERESELTLNDAMDAKVKVHSRVRRIGNSQGFILPKEITDALGWMTGMSLTLTTSGNRLLLSA